MGKEYKTEKELFDKAIGAKNKTVKNLFDNNKIKEENENNKGKLGQIIEKYFFGYNVNSDSSADFKNLGIELKTAPLKKLKNNNIVPKERIKLTTLNIDDLLNNKEITDSKIWKKINKILFMFYLYNDDFLKNKFTLIDIIQMDYFIEIIQQDWTLLRDKFINRNQLISEGDTTFLGLARNGSGGRKEKKIKHPCFDEPFYKRAWVIKTFGVKEILKLIETKEQKEENSNQQNNKIIVKSKASFLARIKHELVNKTIKEIIYENKIETLKESKAKNIASLTIAKAFGVNSVEKLQEKFFLEEGKEFTIKTLPLKSLNPIKLKEEFKINIDIVKEVQKKKSFFDSKFSKTFENDFLLFTYYRKNNKTDIIDCKIVDVKIINFNNKEIDWIQDIYEEFLKRYYHGGLVDGKGNLNFIKKSDDVGIHFRPSGKNKNDTFISTYGEKATKTRMWINSDVIIRKIEDID